MMTTTVILVAIIFIFVVIDVIIETRRFAAEKRVEKYNKKQMREILTDAKIEILIEDIDSIDITYVAGRKVGHSAGVRSLKKHIAEQYNIDLTEDLR